MLEVVSVSTKPGRYTLHVNSAAGVRYRLDLDLQKLEALCLKALNNKSNSAREAGGAIVAKHVGAIKYDSLSKPNDYDLDVAALGIVRSFAFAVVCDRTATDGSTRGVLYVSDKKDEASDFIKYRSRNDNPRLYRRDANGHWSRIIH